MIFYLHYILFISGLSGASVLLGVYIKAYSDASEAEIGALLMTIPFVNLCVKPIFCSMADRRQAHHLFLMLSLLSTMIGFMPFLVLPFFPSFYEQNRRLSWYIQMVSCLVGHCSLNVASTLGDCLAVNYSQKTGTPFGRMRLMGTLSWGIYGFIIGQINETPALPKYLPAFIILHTSLAMELLLLAFWDRSVFEMVDPLSQQPPLTDEDNASQRQSYRVGRLNSSVSLVSMASQDLARLSLTREQAASRLTADNKDGNAPNQQANQQQADSGSPPSPTSQPGAGPLEQRVRAQTETTIESRFSLGKSSLPREYQLEKGCPAAATRKNPQMILFKMIFIEDGRLLKYMILFTMAGVFLSSGTFFFVSVETLCRERGYNFSQLAGAILMSQAFIETVAFLVVPYLLNFVPRWSMMSFGLAFMSMRYVFYSGWYYDPAVSPYWAVLAEWSHGLPFAIFCTIMMDVALMFSNESRLFIPELRRLGYLAADPSKLSRAAIEAEKQSVKMALRATMQSVLAGLMDGLGSGGGSLLCGLFSELYSYPIVWLIYATLSVGTFLLHLLTEVASGLRWSDSYRPKEGTKAYEIMELSRQADEAQRQRSREKKQAQAMINGGAKSKDRKGCGTLATAAAKRNSDTEPPSSFSSAQ